MGLRATRGSCSISSDCTVRPITALVASTCGGLSVTVMFSLAVPTVSPTSNVAVQG